MSERDLDSSINDYIETETPKNYVKQQEWDMTIGLQEVDNLKPSKYLEKLLQENVIGEKTIYEFEHELKQYYVEKNKKYDEMNIVDAINNIANFSSRIWQIHSFGEGNTRTIALFIEKYLVSLGYDVDNTMFKEKSVYYRNALVRSNYFNNYLNIKQDNSFLIKFYENLLLGKNNNLHSRDLIVEELFDKEN